MSLATFSDFIHKVNMVSERERGGQEWKEREREEGREGGKEKQRREKERGNVALVYMTMQYYVIASITSLLRRSGVL